MLIIAFPMVVSHACETAMIFTDRLFLSRLAPEVMNAAMAGGLTSFMMMTFFVGLITYSTALVAQYLGSGQKNRCSLVTTQCLLIAAAAYPLILSARPLVMYMFEHSGIEPAQLAAQKLYFNILIFAVIVSLIRYALSSFFSGVGRTRVVMASSAAAMVVNIAANYILIFGKLGVAPLGIRGAAYGTVIGSISGAAMLLFFYLRRKNAREFKLFTSFRFDRAVMGKLITFGYPSGVEFFLNLFAFNIVVLIFHSVSLSTATAATIMFNWDMVSFIPLLGVQVGVMSLVGRYMGAGEPHLAHRSTMSGCKLGLVYSLFILILFVGAPRQLVLLFRPQAPDVIFTTALPIAVTMIRLAALYVLVEALMVTFIGALKGAGDTFWAMCFSIALHWVLVPVIYVMLKVLHLSAQAAWFALIVIFLTFSTLVYFRYRSGRWQGIRVVEKEIPVALIEGFHEPVDI
jgi:MATE family multidrug resistance protein